MEAEEQARVDTETSAVSPLGTRREHHAHPAFQFFGPCASVQPLAERYNVACPCVADTHTPMFECMCQVAPCLSSAAPESVSGPLPTYVEQRRVGLGCHMVARALVSGGFHARNSVPPCRPGLKETASASAKLHAANKTQLF